MNLQVKINKKMGNLNVVRFKDELIEKKESCLNNNSDEEVLRTTSDSSINKIKDNVFENKSINELMIYFSIPAIISLILESLSSMIDTSFAGHLGKVSNCALSAMGMLNPILSLLVAVQLIFGVSTGIAITKEIGENNVGRINNTFKVGLYSTILFSVFVSLIIFFMQDELLNIIGASGEIRILAKEYLNIALVFNIFSSLGYTLVNSIRAFGYPKMEIVIIVSTTIINIILNVLFTFIFNIGIIGIAIATLISEVFYVIYATMFLLKKNLWIKRSKLNIIESKHILILLLKIGFVQFLMQLLNSLNGFTINKVLVNYNEIIYIGAWSICNSVYMMLLLPLIGFTEGIQSVMSYYHGSHNENKKSILKVKTMKCSIIYSLIVIILVYTFDKNIIGIFTNDSSIVNSAINITKIMLLGFPFMGIIYTLVSYMQVIGQGENASKLEFVRQIILFIPLCIIIPILINKFNMMGINPSLGVFFAMPISNIIATFLYTGMKIR